MSYRQKLIKVRVVTIYGTKEFDNLEDAHLEYPQLNLYRASWEFTAALEDGEFLRFESWQINNANEED